MRKNDSNLINKQTGRRVLNSSITRNRRLFDNSQLTSIQDGKPRNALSHDRSFEIQSNNVSIVQSLNNSIDYALYASLPNPKDNNNEIHTPGQRIDKENEAINHLKSISVDYEEMESKNQEIDKIFGALNQKYQDIDNTIDSENSQRMALISAKEKLTISAKFKPNDTVTGSNHQDPSFQSCRPKMTSGGPKPIPITKAFLLQIMDRNLKYFPKSPKNRISLIDGNEYQPRSKTRNNNPDDYKKMKTVATENTTPPPFKNVKSGAIIRFNKLYQGPNELTLLHNFEQVNMKKIEAREISRDIKKKLSENVNTRIPIDKEFQGRLEQKLKLMKYGTKSRYLPQLQQSTSKSKRNLSVNATIMKPVGTSYQGEKPLELGGEKAPVGIWTKSEGFAPKVLNMTQLIRDSRCKGLNSSMYIGNSNPEKSKGISPSPSGTRTPEIQPKDKHNFSNSRRSIRIVDLLGGMETNSPSISSPIKHTYKTTAVYDKLANILQQKSYGTENQKKPNNEHLPIRQPQINFVRFKKNQPTKYLFKPKSKVVFIENEKLKVVFVENDCA